MSVKKLPNTLSTDELLAALDNSDEKEIILEDESSVLGFISYYNLSSGTHKVRQNLLFKLYRQWTKNPLNKASFIETMKDYFETVYAGTILCFLINITAIDLGKKAVKSLEYTPNRTLSKRAKTHFEAFLKHYNIRIGKRWVELNYLYHLYDKWQYNNKTKSRLSKNQLIKFLKLYFEHKQSNHKKYYKLYIGFLNDKKEENISKKSN